jgi:hypothetical protein
MRQDDEGMSDGGQNDAITCGLSHSRPARTFKWMDGMKNGRTPMTLLKHTRRSKQKYQKYPNSFRYGTRIVNVSRPVNLITRVSVENTSRLSYICSKYKLTSLTLSVIIQEQSITGNKAWTHTFCIYWQNLHYAWYVRVHWADHV